MAAAVVSTRDVVSDVCNSARNSLMCTERLVHVGCPVGNPKREGMMSTAASFLLVIKPRFNRPVGERRRFRRCNSVETCTQTTNHFVLTIQRGCQAHRFC